MAGAQCKVGGRWYPYNSQQCGGKEVIEPPPSAAVGTANPTGAGLISPAPTDQVSDPAEVREIVATTRRVTTLALVKGNLCEQALAGEDGPALCSEFLRYVDDELAPWEKKSHAVPVGGMVEAGVAADDLKFISSNLRVLEGLISKARQLPPPSTDGSETSAAMATPTTSESKEPAAGEGSL